MSLATVPALIPLWAVFGIVAAGLSSAQMLLQERFKTAPLPMAFWSKAACALVMLPFVVAVGLPANPVYYALLVAQSLLWVVSDVIFYRGINDVGAGVVARILPMATFASFFLWFAVDWPLASAYAAQPLHSAMIAGVFGLSAYFAWHLKECPVTRKALRVIWFVLFANVAGSLSTKIITRYAGIEQGISAYIFCEALIMIAMWLIYYAIKKPVPARIMFGWPSIKAGLIVGSVAGFAIAATVYAVYHIDNPAYVSAVRYLDAVMIFFYYRATGRPNHGHVWAGLGIVACAAALVVLKAQG